ncbi:MAG TPA: SRPBCC family protein [Candidatus Limnocylindrales bacterium]|jgi:hypothetical protein
MTHSQATVRVARPLAATFDYVGTHMRENHPSWEPEVLEIRPLTAGPMAVGSRAVMVRRDMGKVHETTYEVTRFEPGRRVAVRHMDGPMDFALDLAFAAAGPDATDITSTVDIRLRGPMRLMTPVFWLTRDRTTRRIAQAMARAVETHREASAPGRAGVGASS